MQLLLRRYRDLTVLVLVLAVQVLLLAWQVRTGQDVRLIRVWAVASVMPMARVVEFLRANTIGVARDYLQLVDARSKNKELEKQLGRLKMENQFLKTELSTADRARALASFQSRSPSRTLAARLIGSATSSNSRVVYLDRGSSSGVRKGMAVVTPDGIAGKIVAAFPSVSQMMMVTDPAFAAGVVSQRMRIHGTLKGQSPSICIVDYIQNEDDVKEGDWFFTSGDDRIFPKGLPVGRVKSTRTGGIFREIRLEPSGTSGGVEEVLIVVEGVHQEIPEGEQSNQELHMLPRPPAAPESDPNKMIDFSTTGSALTTDADQVLERYRRLGTAQGHIYGAGGVPNFNIPVPDAPRAAPPKPPQASAAPAGQRVPGASQPAVPPTPGAARPR
ncbi:MAG: rod shape-determining protein MreC [Bryobacterales bacterium]|nr:rod shape-determining protein MreC [Bryobacterales bacterium]